MTSRVLFRVDAGPEIGLGHLQRCLSLATTLREHGTTSVFLSCESPRVMERIGGYGFQTIPLNGKRNSEEPLAILKIVADLDCKICVVDSYFPDASYYRSLLDAGLFVVAIRDDTDLSLPCSLFINGGIHARETIPTDSKQSDRFLLGPQYALLRDEFLTSHQRGIRKVRGVVSNILVTLGGADEKNFAPLFIDIAAELPGDFSITVIVGPFFKNETLSKNANRPCTHPVHLVYSPTSVLPLMREADLAVSGGGQTLYELASVGCPTLAVRLSENQDSHLTAFARLGFLLITTPMRLKDDLSDLLANAEQREFMGKVGLEIVDGRGSHRVAEALLKRFQTL